MVRRSSQYETFFDQLQFEELIIFLYYKIYCANTIKICAEEVSESIEKYATHLSILDLWSLCLVLPFLLWCMHKIIKQSAIISFSIIAEDTHGVKTILLKMKIYKLFAYLLSFHWDSSLWVVFFFLFFFSKLPRTHPSGFGIFMKFIGNFSNFTQSWMIFNSDLHPQFFFFSHTAVHMKFPWQNKPIYCYITLDYYWIILFLLLFSFVHQINHFAAGYERFRNLLVMTLSNCNPRSAPVYCNFPFRWGLIGGKVRELVIDIKLLNYCFPILTHERPHAFARVRGY